MKRKEHQSGFSTMVILLFALVITALIATSLVVYQHHKPINAKSTAATTQTQTTTQPANTTTTQPAVTTSTQYLDIKEWGVRLTLNSDTASLYYYMNPQVPGVAYLSLKTISDVEPTCAANNGPLGAISRMTTTEQQTAQSSTHTAPGTIKIGNYWYGYEGTHADCTNGTATAQAAVSKAAPNYNSSTLMDTFKTLEASPTSN